MDNTDDQWRNLVNKYPDDLPSNGTDAPKMESIPVKTLRDGETPVMLQKLITEVYVYTAVSDPKEIWFASESFQHVYLLGQMRLADAQKIILTAKNKRGRNKK